MKILISCGSYSWGGLEITALENAHRLLLREHDVTYLCPEGSKSETEAEKLNLKVLPILNKGIGTLTSISKLKKILNEQSFDIIHTHLSHDLSTIVPALNSSKSKAKLFLSKHMRSGVNKKDFFHRYLYNRLTASFAVSNYVKESFVRTCPVDENKVYILPTGVDLSKFKPNLYDKQKLKKEYNILNSKIIIGIVGRITPGKGHEEFLLAAKNFLQIRNDVQFLIIGGASYGEEDYETKIKQLANEYNLNNNLIFTGHTDNIIKMFSLLDILAFPSHDESYGLTLVEAMALELPVAASNFGGILDIVVNNETGLLFQNKDANELANALYKLIENPELRNTLGKNGRKRAEEHFGIEQMLDKQEIVYRETN